MENTRASKRQKELLSFVDGFIQGHGYGPSYREIMRALGYKSVSTVATHLDGLITKGYLRKRDNLARSLEVIHTTLSPSVPKAATASQEKWFLAAITGRFDTLDTAFDSKVLDEVYVLVGALKILGLDDAHLAMKTRLQAYVKEKANV